MTKIEVKINAVSAPFAMMTSAVAIVDEDGPLRKVRGLGGSNGRPRSGQRFSLARRT
jgi:hypothetical protein